MTPSAKMALAGVLLLIPALSAQAAQSIERSPHNLSANGGTVRATSEQEICIFCHTPHHSKGVTPLWNRNVPTSSYRIYSSPTLKARPGMPAGSSKLCLSCHDGTIALGEVLNRTELIPFEQSVTTIPERTNLGTDLSGSHPISFTYDPSSNTSLAATAALPHSIKLTKSNQLECRACHDPHDNTNGNFLVMDNSQSQLCQACHIQHQTDVTGHSGCADCHQSHKSPSGPFLLRADNESDTCLLCHSGSAPSAVLANAVAGRTGGLLSPGALPAVSPAATVSALGSLTTPTIPHDRAGPNVAPDMVKRSIHDSRSPVKLVRGDTKVSNCADCHEPHTMTKATASAPNLPGSFGRVSGIDASGAKVRVARYEYEVCFRCHSDKRAVRPTISRQVPVTNLRLEFATNAISFHPVVGPGKNQNVPSLRRTMTPGTMIYCNDCHSSDTGHKSGALGPDGTHGSDFSPLLVARYETRDGAFENADTYALCYRCHDRASILHDESFSRHKIHIVDARTPCSVCHDPHGISSVQGMPQRNTHLINFDTSVARPDPVTKRFEYQSLGSGSGLCYVSCHGKVHSGTRYP